MALIYCPECGKQVSEKAPTCPNCGAPIATITATGLEISSEPPKFTSQRMQKKQYTFGPSRLIVGLVFLFIGISVFKGGGPELIYMFCFVVGIPFIILAFRVPCLFCADCGQYLGTGVRSCPRCGCNLWTYYPTGVGQTVKEGSKNY
jgi:hypothetical protein